MISDSCFAVFLAVLIYDPNRLKPPHRFWIEFVTNSCIASSVLVNEEILLNKRRICSETFSEILQLELYICCGYGKIGKNSSNQVATHVWQWCV